ncbi:MAG TPA: hypothetical protein VHM02_10560, partial [Thermoanaerobaculia bacterium]|nr:hypothetical protein [Thermoanaerobaculia bacterium]
MPTSVSSPPGRSSRRRIAVAGALIGAAVALAAVSVGRHLAESAERRDVLARFAAVAGEVGDAERAQV